MASDVPQAIAPNAQYQEIAPRLMNQPIGTLQGKPETDRAPFLRAARDDHRDGHIVARLIGLWEDDLLHQRCGSLKGTLANRIIEYRALEIISSTVGGDNSVMQMGHGVHHIRVMGRQPFRDLFQFGEVVAEEIPLTERRQLSPKESARNRACSMIASR